MMTTRFGAASWTSIGALLAFGGMACESPSAGKPKADVAPAAAPQQAPAPATAKAERLTFSNATSKIQFVAAKVSLKHDGQFKAFTGTADLVDGEPGKVRVEIDLGSVETDTPKLTGHLKSEDFFHVEQFPKAVFESTRIVAGGSDGATHTVTGNLDLHGVTKSVTFPATIRLSDREATLKADFGIDRKDWKIVYPGMPDDLIQDDVLIKLDIRIPREKT